MTTPLRAHRVSPTINIRAMNLRVMSPVFPASHELEAVRKISRLPGHTRALKKLVRKYKNENKKLQVQNAALLECCTENKEKVLALWSELSGPAKRGLLLRGLRP